MCIFEILALIGKQYGDEICATHVLPHLLPLLVEKALNATQFASILKEIKEMLKTIEMNRLAAFEEQSRLVKEAPTVETKGIYEILSIY